MDVVRFTHNPGDFDVFVRTDNIANAYSNFRGRIGFRNMSADEKSDPDKYCRYFSSADCSISLRKPAEEDSEMVVLPDMSDLYWPVIFETCQYQICIKFHGIDAGSKPQIIHIREDVERPFFLDVESDPSEARLTGEVDFLNEPGLFKLCFEYQKEGKRKEAFVSFDVVSPKLDTKHDYKRILAEVNEEFEDLILNYLSVTYQQLGAGKTNNLEVWMQVFQGVVHNYLKNIDRIIKNPHSKTRTQRQFAKADRIKRWSPAMEEVFAEKRAADKLDEYYFGYEQYETTVNSLENRFIKYTLKNIGGHLSEIFSKLLNSSVEGLSENYVKEWRSYQQQIEKYLKHPFFKAVGNFEGLRQESLVLQSRMGYQQVYKDWLKLKKGIDFYNGATNIGTLQIWEIYELWCFIKVKKMVREILGFDPSKPNAFYIERGWISEPNGPLIRYSEDKQTDYRLVMRYPDPNDELFANLPEDKKQLLALHQGEELSIHYQHTFSRNFEDDFQVQTVTTEQRPDIVLNIKKPSGFVLTYLYDAKYRVWSDKKLDKNFEKLDAEEQEKLLAEANRETASADQILYGADYPPSDAINQMHRYRDAIYYSMEKGLRPDSKEIIGGYILFPGRGDDAQIKKRYFYKSIAAVNIGAFPLLPTGGKKDADGRDTDAPQLWEHLSEILFKEEPIDNLLEESIPQRGLQYTEDTSLVSEESLLAQAKTNDDFVLVDYADAAHKELFLKIKKCYVRAGLQGGSLQFPAGWDKAKFVFLHSQGHGDLFPLADKPPIVVSAENLRELGFMPSHDGIYLLFDLKNPKPTETDLDMTKKYPHKLTAPQFIRYSDLFE